MASESGGARFSWVCFAQLAFAFSEVKCFVCRLHAAFSGSALDLLRCFGCGSGFVLFGMFLVFFLFGREKKSRKQRHPSAGRVKAAVAHTAA